MKTIKPIRTKLDYNIAMKRIDVLVLRNPKKGTAEYDELDVIGTLVAAYEDVYYPITIPNKI